MTKSEMENALWWERYRPTSLSQIILTDEQRKKLQTFVDQKSFPHIFFAGSPGTGKTTTARALCNDVGVEYLFINASLESSIDLLRDKLSGFARTMSLDGEKKKAVILDEVDGVTSPAFFPALRPMMELFAKNCTFIMTANYPEKVPPAIKSRLQTHVFDITDRKWYATEQMRICEDLLKKEGVDYDKKIVAKIIMKFFPDFRCVINALQQHQGFLKDPQLEYRLDGMDVSKLFAAMKKGDFAEIRTIIQQDITITESVYTQIYQAIKDHVDPAKIPAGILCIDDYMRSHTFCVDKEIHLTAFLIDFIRACGPFK